MIKKSYIVQIFLVLNLVLDTNESSVFGFSIITNSTNSTTDSLIYESFKVHRFTDFDSALYYAKLYLDEVKGDDYNTSDLDQFDRLARAHNAIGYSYKNLSKYDSALFHYRLGNTYAEKFDLKQRQMFFHSNSAIVFKIIGMYDSSLVYNYKSLEIAKELDDLRQQVAVINNIGNIYLGLDDIRTALDFYLESASIKENQNFSGLAVTYYNIGLCYERLNDNLSAINYYNKVLNRCETSEDCEPHRVERTMVALGNSHLALGNLEKAREHILKGINSDRPLTKIQANRNLAELERVEGNYYQALKLVDRNLLLSREFNLKPQRLNAARQKAELYQDLKNFDSALFYFKTHYALKDTIFNIELEGIRKFFTEQERKQADKVIQGKDQEILVRERANILFGLVIILSVALIGWITLDLIKRRRRNEYLDKQVELKTSELTSSNTRLIEKSKDLDNLIYKISHEIRGPLARLLGLIGVGKIEYEHDAKGYRYYEMLEDEANNLENILKRMIVINNVNHHNVKMVHVKARDFLTDLLKKTSYIWQDKIDVKTEVDIEVESFSTDISLLEVSLQHMIHNAVKFRKSTSNHKPELKISATKNGGGQVDITVSDNGFGFDEKFKTAVTDLFFVASEKGGAGMGLHHAKLALNKLGAQLDIVSTRNPTTFKIHLQ